MWPTRRDRIATVAFHVRHRRDRNLGLVRGLKIRPGQEAIHLLRILRGDDFLKCDEIRREFAQSAIDEIDSSGIAFVVPDIEGQDAHMHGTA